MFRIEMLPAEQGDALFIEYGSASSPHRVLIDAGVRKTSGLVGARIGELPASKRHFDLLIVTHVDSDHIGGIPKLLADTSLGVTFDDVWFNGWRHLQPDRLGPVEGEIFSAQLDKREWDWNAAFDEKAVVVRPRGRLPKRELPGGMTLTLLSPTRHRLEVLRDEWKKVVEEAGLEAGVQDENLAEAARRKGIPDLLGDRLDVEELADVPLLPDKAPANGSTIAVLAEYGEGNDRKSCLLTGDAHPDVFEEGLKRLCKDRRSRPHRRQRAQGAAPRQPLQRVKGCARPGRDRALPVLDERHSDRPPAPRGRRTHDRARRRADAVLQLPVGIH